MSSEHKWPTGNAEELINETDKACDELKKLNAPAFMKRNVEFLLKKCEDAKKATDQIASIHKKSIETGNTRNVREIEKLGNPNENPDVRRIEGLTVREQIGAVNIGLAPSPYETWNPANLETPLVSKINATKKTAQEENDKRGGNRGK